MIKEPFARSVWISFVIIVASIAIAGGALYYFVGDLDADATAIVNARASLQQQTEALANLASLKHQAEVAVPYEDAINQLLPNQYGLVTFTQWFSDAGRQYNVSASAGFEGDVNPSQGSTPGNASFSFTVQGMSLSEIASFLQYVSGSSTEFLVNFGTYNVTSGGGYTIQGQGTVFSQ